MTTYTTEITPEVLTAAESIYDGWFADAAQIDWENFLDRLDGIELDDGTRLDLGNDLLAPPIKAIKAHIKRYRAS